MPLMSRHSANCPQGEGTQGLRAGSGGVAAEGGSTK